MVRGEEEGELDVVATEGGWAKVFLLGGGTPSEKQAGRQAGRGKAFSVRAVVRRGYVCRCSRGTPAVYLCVCIDAMYLSPDVYINKWLCVVTQV